MRHSQISDLLRGPWPLGGSPTSERGHWAFSENTKKPASAQLCLYTISLLQPSPKYVILDWDLAIGIVLLLNKFHMIGSWSEYAYTFFHSELEAIDRTFCHKCVITTEGSVVTTHWRQKVRSIVSSSDIKLLHSTHLQVNLPTAIPFVYTLDDDLKAVGPRRYLADEETVRAAVDKVANIRKKWMGRKFIDSKFVTRCRFLTHSCMQKIKIPQLSVKWLLIV